MSVTPTPSWLQPWFPSCFTWQPVHDPLGREKKTLRRRKGSEEVFGIPWSNARSHELIGHSREIFAETIFAQLVVPFVRIPWRILRVLTGDFVTPGLEKAERAWELRCQDAAIHLKSVPSSWRRTLLQIHYVAQEALKNIAKIGLYLIVGFPLGPLWWIALYGAVFNPLDAGFLFAKLEGWTARDHFYVMPDRIEESRLCNNYSMFVTDYLLPCQQSDTVLETPSVFAARHGERWTREDPLFSIGEMLRERRVFFEKEGIDVGGLLKDLRFWKLLQKSLALDDKEFQLHLSKLRGVLQQVVEHRLFRLSPMKKEQIQQERTEIMLLFKMSRENSVFGTLHIQQVLEQEEFKDARQEEIREIIELRGRLEALQLPNAFQTPENFESSLSSDGREQLRKETVFLETELRAGQSYEPDLSHYRFLSLEQSWAPLAT